MPLIGIIVLGAIAALFTLLAILVWVLDPNEDPNDEFHPSRRHF